MGRLTEPVHESYSVLMSEGIDAWIQRIPTELVAERQMST
jgi:hypothetical protein